MSHNFMVLLAFILTVPLSVVLWACYYLCWELINDPDYLEKIKRAKKISESSKTRVYTK